MKDSLRSGMYMLAPCVALGALGFWLSRRSPLLVKPIAPVYVGPFTLSVAGVEAQKNRPVEVYDGYDRHFQMLFRDKGERPKWWGAPLKTATGESITGWTFWLERGKRRTAFAPTKTLLWTTQWDSQKKRYFKEFLLNCGEVSTDAALKMKGQTSLSRMTRLSVFSASMPFEVTLKKAGEKWVRPQISTDPGATIKSIEISRPLGGEVTAKVVVLLSRGIAFGGGQDYGNTILGPNWKPSPDNLAGAAYSSFVTDVAAAAPGSRRIVREFMWKASDITNDPLPDLVLTQCCSIAGHWPFEIAFPIKKNGKPLSGKIPVLTRPRGK